VWLGSVHVINIAHYIALKVQVHGQNLAFGKFCLASEIGFIIVPQAGSGINQLGKQLL